MQAATSGIDCAIYTRAEKRDVPEILALQKIAYQSEAELYGDDSLPGLQQTLPEIEEEFGRAVFMKAVVNSKIVGSIRGRAEGSTARFTRCIVHPYFQKRGIGRRLIGEIEQVWPAEVTNFEAVAGHKSKRRLLVYGKLGYQPYKTESFLPNIEWVILQKARQ
jgi:GNAT superfamily N-acetyltransferase